ncbi:MAG: chromosomal replication initiator protein DnaA [Microscillaceae bacterium]|nr:chromosomal replication initiator protein DnaA [Microscillaceae bacterium]
MENTTTSITTENDRFAVWENCLQVIRQHIEEQAFMTWFEPIKPFRLEKNVLTIQVPSKFFYEYLEENFVELLRKAIDFSLGINGSLEYSVIVDEENQVNQAYFAQLTQTPTQKKYANGKSNNTYINNNSKQQYLEQKRNFHSDLNINYTFDNFIEGDCNRLARSAGLAVAQKPGVTSFNPLMLYGGVGLGKTHLVQAIGNYIQTYEEGKEVLYVSADKFTNQFIEALKNNNLELFNHFYMHVDVLMIDDVQFLAGKERTQEIFFHIFNHLHQSGKQIIMTSDCPPIELKGLEERLLSRFKWGLTADLKQPDLETRMAIIHKKLQDESLELPVDVIEYLAHSIDSNVRELEGSLVSLIAQASLNNTPINMDLAKQTVQKIVQSVESKELSIDEVQKCVSDYFGLTVEDLKAKTRKKEIVTARQIAMYFAKEYTGFSLKSIGYHFGGRDHSTVIHAIQTVNEYMMEKRELKLYIEDIERKLFSRK